jgi:hypothetical protein
MLRWVELGGVVVYPFEPKHLSSMVSWMQRYTESQKRDMDLADASLMWLATEMMSLAIWNGPLRHFNLAHPQYTKNYDHG